MVRLDKVSRAAVDALEDVKARDVVVFDVKKMTAYFDKVIVATGDSNRHCRALASRVQEGVKAAGGKIYGVEGEKTGEWLLVDIGDAVVHIMQPAIRLYYNIEELWAPAPKAAKAAKVAKSDKPAKRAKSAKPPAKAVKGSKRSAPRKAAASRTPAATRTPAKPRRTRAKTA
ncbi:MAG: ribosome silencing factor [Burkholderiales bacterium]